MYAIIYNSCAKCRVVQQCILYAIVGSCALYALLKPNALKNQKRTFNPRDQV